MPEQIPNVHELKISPRFFPAVNNGEKPFEVRKNDRGFRQGDVLYLREHSSFEGYTGRSCTKVVTYLLDDPQYVKDGFVVMGLR